MLEIILGRCPIRCSHTDVTDTGFASASRLGTASGGREGAHLSSD